MKLNKSWFALYTKPRSEFKAAEQLKLLNINYYLPVVEKIKQWSDRKKKVDEVLIKSYIFINADESERLAAVELHSIVRCMFFKGKPAVIPDWQMESFINLIESKAEILVNDGLIKGTKIIIKDGPFTGIKGILLEDYNGKQIAVSLELINRTITAKLTKESVIEIIKDF